ncbi:VOC family protein [Aquibium sp. ELW1220]|uniref:VOC family protein n=1 Tax=Aquibium sp. ELW1220 TaxID=2976766 RepID=UPI0025AFC15A|nr:VOC family protein [Aquibium sp. ELW1220]MDN2579447.1 VOC family protein [Aquibium sp. ELW1220]
MRFSHLGIVARDASRLAEFYRHVFGCKDRRNRVELSGEKVSRGNGLPHSEIISIWLELPGIEKPFLEIHQYGATCDRGLPRVNEPGYGHIAFEVGDIRAIRDGILNAGGQDQGEITNLGSVRTPFLAIYMRDPEGNLIELEQI